MGRYCPHFTDGETGLLTLPEVTQFTHQGLNGRSYCTAWSRGGKPGSGILGVCPGPRPRKPVPENRKTPGTLGVGPPVSGVPTQLAGRKVGLTAWQLGFQRLLNPSPRQPSTPAQLAQGLPCTHTHVKEPRSAHLHSWGRAAGRTALPNRECKTGRKIPSGQRFYPQ